MLPHSSLLLLSNLLLLLGLLFVLVRTQDVQGIRVRRAPAVWGAPAPDYSEVDLRGDGLRYIHALLFVDSLIMDHYENDFIRVKSKILLLAEEANRYLNQLNVAMVVLDILPLMRSDFSLYTFQEFRNQRLAQVVEHDFAVLFSHKYAGGLAFVDGLCSPQSVMLCGFFPQEPKAMGGIFFHEIAHLLGVPHKPANSTLYVPNCPCPNREDNRRRRESGHLTKRDTTTHVASDPGCLRIPGFDHDCTAQQFVNFLYKNRCVKSLPMKFTRSEPICGNSVVEEGEDCDCGLPEVCSMWNCMPQKCEYRVHPVFLWLIAFCVAVTFFSISSFVLYRRGFLQMFTSCLKRKQKAASAYASTVLNEHYLQSPYSPRKAKVSDGGSSVVVLLDRPPRAGTSSTLQRPRMPPPPPPKTRISVQQNNGVPNAYEIPNSQQQKQCDPDSISWKFDSFDSDEEDLSVPVPFPAESGIPCRPNYPSTVPINRITVSTIHSSGETLATDLHTSSSISSSGDVKL